MKLLIHFPLFPLLSVRYLRRYVPADPLAKLEIGLVADTASSREQVSLRLGQRPALLAPLDVTTGPDQEHVSVRARTLSLQEGIEPKEIL